MTTHTEENYLKVLFTLAQTKGEAGINDISKLLDIKMPTVNSMMKRLADKGYVIYESYKPPTLTKKGKKEAALIIRKHRLTEMYLVEKMGFGWEEVHEIAEQIEHIKSNVFFDKMDALLGFPTVDPHGSPIPDPSGKIHPINYLKLSECIQGEKVIFKAVAPTSDELLRFLNNHLLVLNTIIHIEFIESYDKSMTLSYGNKKDKIFSKSVCEKLLVDKI